jgi:hypothetical protein
MSPRLSAAPTRGGLTRGPSTFGRVIGHGRAHRATSANVGAQGRTRAAPRSEPGMIRETRPRKHDWEARLSASAEPPCGDPRSSSPGPFVELQERHSTGGVTDVELAHRPRDKVAPLRGGGHSAPPETGRNPGAPWIAWRGRDAIGILTTRVASPCSNPVGHAIAAPNGNAAAKPAGRVGRDPDCLDGGGQTVTSASVAGLWSRIPAPRLPRQPEVPGRRTSKRAPPDSASVTRMDPSCRSTIQAAMASPSPEPEPLREVPRQKRSNTRSRWSGGMP